MKSIDRYLARLIALPLFVSLLIAAMLLILDRIRLLLDFVISNGGPVRVIWEMLANLLPEYLGLGIPIGLLLGVLLTFRRLATSSELDVMRGVGMSYGRLLRVPYAYALLLAVANFYIVGYIQPRARYNYEGLRFELRTGALGASIKVGEFAQFGPKMTIRVEQSRDNGRKLTGIFVQQRTDADHWASVTAQGGEFLSTDDPDTILFRLRNGTLIHEEPGFGAPRVLSFASHDLPIPLPKYENFRTRGGGKSIEWTLPELARLGRHAETREEREQTRAEFHYRIAEVATMFLLPLLGVALGVPPKRSTSAIGVFLSIVMIVAYYKINGYAESVGERGGVDPLLAVWIPWALFAALVVWMYHQIAFVPGGQPIGGLERVSGKAAKWIARHLPRRRRQEALA